MAVQDYSQDLLSQIRTGKRQRPRRTMLYGVEGVGKSTFGSMAPSPIFLPTEDGLDHIECATFPLLESWEMFVGALCSLRVQSESDGGSPYKTIVVDSLDWLEKLIWAQVCEDNSVKSIESIGYAKGYTFAVDYWREVLGYLDWLRNNAGMGCVLLAHSQIERFEDPLNPSYDRYGPRLHKKASPIVREWCDEVLFATYETIVKTHDEGFDKKRGQAVGDGKRVMYTSERPGHQAKNRLSLPDKLPLDYREYSKHFETEDK